MTNGDPEGRIFISDPHTHDRFLHMPIQKCSSGGGGVHAQPTEEAFDT